MDGTVDVMAEWARWGKERHDKGYHLLECSDGVLGSDGFRTVLTRYSPGTIKTVPQVTVSWLEVEPGDYYLGMAFHDQPDGDLLDADDREIVQTNYFSVPFRSLAAGAVSYLSMYETFSQVRLPSANGHPIPLTLATGTSAAGSSEADRRETGTEASGSAPPDWLTMRAAALLLTGKPVCVLRGQNASLTDRLRFLDAVATLLPYGMRSQLSASTWASSIYREHKLRLFFATTPRANDQAITWDSGIDRSSIDDRQAHLYEAWLKERYPSCIAELADEKVARGFTPREIMAVLRPRTARRNSLVSASSDRKPLMLDDPPTTSAHVASVEELLVSCARQFTAKSSGVLKDEIEKLRQHLTDQVTDQERAHYRELIATYAMLNEHRINAALQADLYEVLLRLAYGAPLTYGTYCAIEDAYHGKRGMPRPFHRSLAQVVAERIGVDSINLNLLVQNGIDKDSAARLLGSVAFDVQIAMAADMAESPRWYDGHAQTVCNLVIKSMTSQNPPSSKEQKEQFRAALQQHGFLAPALSKVAGQTVRYQLSMLSDLLRTAYDKKLPRLAVKDIFTKTQLAPTGALLAAVLSMCEPEHAPLAERLFTRALIDRTDLDQKTKHQVLRGLPPAAEPPRHSGEQPTVMQRMLSR